MVAAGMIGCVTLPFIKESYARQDAEALIHQQSKANERQHHTKQEESHKEEHAHTLRQPTDSEYDNQLYSPLLNGAQVHPR